MGTSVSRGCLNPCMHVNQFVPLECPVSGFSTPSNIRGVGLGWVLCLATHDLLGSSYPTRRTSAGMVCILSPFVHQSQDARLDPEPLVKVSTGACAGAPLGLGLSPLTLFFLCGPFQLFVPSVGSKQLEFPMHLIIVFFS